MWEALITAALPALVTAAGSYVQNAGAASAANRQRQENNAFTAEQNALDRQSKMDLLMAQLAAGGGGGGGGGANLAIQKKQLELQAYQNAIDAMLTGSQNRHSGAQTLLQGWTLPART